MDRSAGQVAYEAYVDAVVGVSVNGDVLPEWAGVTPNVAAGWNAAAAAVAAWSSTEVDAALDRLGESLAEASLELGKIHAILLEGEHTDPPPASAVTLAMERKTENSVTVQWTVVGPNPAGWTPGRSGFDSNGHGPWDRETPLDGAVREFTFTSLLPATSYVFSVEGVGGSPGATVSVTTNPAAGGATTPPPPTGGTTADHGPVAIRNGWVAKQTVREDFADDSWYGRWNRYNSAGHGGNGLRRPEQWATVDDDAALNGRAVKCTGLPNGTTGGMSLKAGSQRFGRWGVRMRHRGDPDCRYNALALTWPDAENWMKGGGEIDFAEGGAGKAGVNFFLHFSTSGGRSDQQTSGVIQNDPATYSWFEVEWTPDYVRGYCDGVMFFEDTNPKHFNYPAFGAHHLCLQLDWFPDGKKTTGSAEVLYDAVRVYSL
jgi:hypothetical protein